MRSPKLVVLFFLGGLFLLAGCQEKRPLPAKGASSEIVMWLVGSENQARAIQELGCDFFKDKDILFRCEAISWGDARTKYFTSIAGDAFPDIGTMGITWAAEFGSLGAMLDLGEGFPDEIMSVKKKNFPGIWNSLECNGKVYAIPLDLSVQIMFYRNDIVRTPPKTWAEMEEALFGLKQKQKGMIFDWGSMSWIGLAPYLWQAGGDFYDIHCTKSALDSEAAAAALKYFSRLYTEFGVPKAQIPMEQGMRTGDFPLAISGNWKIDTLRLCAPEIKGKWSIAVLPAGPTGKRTAFLGGRSIGIFKKSLHKKESWEFMKFLFEPKTQVALYEAARASQDSYLPTNIDAWEILPMEEEFKSVLKLQAQDAKGPPGILGWDDSTRYIEEAIQRVLLERADIKQELSRAAKEMNRHISK